MHEFVLEFKNWNNVGDHDRVKRQLSVSSDSKLLDEDIREEARVILRPKKPPRPKSEVLLNQGSEHRRTKRYSAFGVSYIVFTKETTFYRQNTLQGNLYYVQLLLWIFVHVVI